MLGMYTHTRTYVRYVRTDSYAPTHKPTPMPGGYTPTYAPMSLHTYAYTYQVGIHIYTYTHTYARWGYTYTCTYTYKPTPT